MPGMRAADTPGSGGEGATRRAAAARGAAYLALGAVEGDLRQQPLGVLLEGGLDRRLGGERRGGLGGRRRGRVGCVKKGFTALRGAGSVTGRRGSCQRAGSGTNDGNRGQGRLSPSTRNTSTRGRGGAALASRRIGRREESLGGGEATCPSRPNDTAAQCGPPPGARPTGVLYADALTH